MGDPDPSDIEIDLFVDALRRCHGYDFQNYARASLKRRLSSLVAECQSPGLVEMVPRLVRDPGFLAVVLSHLSVPVTEMFRDPVVFRAIRERVVPVLETYPRPNIWVAGCATGEEVYSIAILLEEHGLLHRSQIYATDINDIALTRAEEGVFSVKSLAEYADNFAKSGGRRSLLDYFHIKYDFGKITDALRSKIVFAHHNLVADGVFCEVNMILCRNVMIYFNRTLQDRVLSLFASSLVRGGILCVGTRESIGFSDAGRGFRPIDQELRLFKKAGSVGA